VALLFLLLVFLCAIALIVLFIVPPQLFKGFFNADSGLALIVLTKRRKANASIYAGRPCCAETERDR
jgi:hypothetical protein